MQRPFVSTVCVALASLAIGGACAPAAAPVPTTIDPCAAVARPGFEAAAAAARDSIVALMGREPMPGTAVAVVADGELVWSEAFGLANIETARPVCRNTLFRAGSVSKVVTAAALLRLYDDGVLDLDDDIRPYVPAMQDRPDPITFRQLAGHLGGIRHYGRSDYFNTRRFDRVSDGLAIFVGDSLVGPPGSVYHYSSYGYNLLAAAMEGVAGAPYLALIERTVLAPLGLEHTAAESVVEESPHLATPYSGSRDSLRASPPQFDTSDRWPSGGLAASAEDMAWLGAGLLDPDFLAAATRDLVLTSQRTAGGEETGYSIGVRLERDDAGRLMLHHGGTSIGARTFMLVYPDARVSIAVATNGNADFDQDQVATLAALFVRPSPR